MPPMSSLKTFIAALRTGETRTTKALDRAVSRRRGANAAHLIALLHKRGALKAPLQPELRKAVRDAELPERFVQRCIDEWPDAQKEQIRRALVSAISESRPVRFAWGLTPAPRHSTEIDDARRGAVTITALTPRSFLRAHSDGSVDVVPPKAADHKKATTVG